MEVNSKSLQKKPIQLILVQNQPRTFKETLGIGLEFRHSRDKIVEEY